MKTKLTLRTAVSATAALRPLRTILAELEVAVMSGPLRPYRLGLPRKPEIAEPSSKWRQCSIQWS
jgi:hypothetical protein